MVTTCPDSSGWISPLVISLCEKDLHMARFIFYKLVNLWQLFVLICESVAFVFQSSSICVRQVFSWLVSPPVFGRFVQTVF
jgi:hypothetical protein